MRTSALVLTLIVRLAWAQASMAQALPAGCPGKPDSAGTPRHSDEDLAFLYAPQMHFAPQERYFPILPFFNAFLEVEDSTPLTPDLAGQVAPNGKGPDELIVWDQLAREYDTLQNRSRATRELEAIAAARVEAEKYATRAAGLDSLEAAMFRYRDSAKILAVLTQVKNETVVAQEHSRQLSLEREKAFQRFGAEFVPPVAALFYRVYHLTHGESNGVWDRVRSDFQVWDRLRLPNRLRELAKKDSLPCLISMEYYAYYIRDLGLTGHAQDLEKFFVFIPTDSTPVEIMVGAAHSVVTPNNVAILTRDQPRGQPQDYIYPAHALVEYGGHSFSPDVKPLGLFTPGWDINWRSSERSWGVRDIQAILGTGFGGDYRGQYTVPRSDSIGVTLAPLPSSSRLSDATDTTQNHAFYALIPVGPYRQLFDSLALNEGTDSARVERVRLAWDSLGVVLNQRMWPSRRFPSDADTALQVYRRMKLWLKDLGQESHDSIPDQPRKVTALDGSGSKMRPWTANEYTQSPEHIMKAWLYRPQDPDRTCKFLEYFPVHGHDLPNFEFGGRYGVGQKKSHTTVFLEVTDAYHCLERASKLGIPGTLSLGVAASPFAFSRGPQEVYLRYQQRYFSPQNLTWSVGLSVVARYDSGETAEVERNGSERSRFRVRPALSLMPFGLIFGAKMDPNWGNLVLSSVTFRVGPQLDLFHPSRSMAWQMELAVRPIPKFRPRGRRKEVDESARYLKSAQGPAAATAVPPSDQPMPNASP